MKRTLSLILALVMALSLMACGSKKEEAPAAPPAPPEPSAEEKLLTEIRDLLKEQK